MISLKLEKYLKVFFGVMSILLFVSSLTAPAFIFNKFCEHSRVGEYTWNGLDILGAVPFGLLLGHKITYACSANIFGGIALRTFYKNNYCITIFWIALSLFISIMGILNLEGLTVMNDEGGVCYGVYLQFTYGVWLWLGAQLMILVGSILLIIISKFFSTYTTNSTY